MFICLLRIQIKGLHAERLAIFFYSYKVQKSAQCMLKSTNVSVTQDLPRCSHTIETVHFPIHFPHLNTRVSNQFN